ncbi:MAG: hypothetical protein A3F54_01945 [Candidatus Kerfeldbacteria bacterium RIFCSPHIGHO2_12_FULL_48_17]|uniref:Ribose-phosphate pyrophosphokinase N-terminal domain-containing protein n=1 Tax=Candidatus Kerfeldbacteria bacterium RIFCSPHIGHO2_12_FULL_48_17 TaxID=1798542 RepID=A0A1G2AWV1_9BACT|nr:MAG: hypothetical protein A3F54_01945 [Candidatus Kerfeldbacteria bacterium RIFCSPHIGHO2_12_FULL_48_17]
MLSPRETVIYATIDCLPLAQDICALLCGEFCGGGINKETDDAHDYRQFKACQCEAHGRVMLGGFRDNTMNLCADGEWRPRLDTDVRNKRVYVLGPGHGEGQRHWRFLTLLDTVREAGVFEMVALPTVLQGQRDERKSTYRVGIGAKLAVESICLRHPSRIIFTEPHADAILGFANSPTVGEAIYGSKILIPYFLKNFDVENIVWFAPDKGAVDRCRKYRQFTGSKRPMAFGYKEHIGQNELSEEEIAIVGDVAGADVWLPEDMVDTGNTLCKVGDAVMRAGARSVNATATHSLLSGNAIERLAESGIKNLVCLDTVRHPPEKLHVEGVNIVQLSSAPLYAETLARCVNGKSFSKMINRIGVMA